MRRFLLRLVFFLIVPVLVILALDVHLRTMNTGYKDKVSGLVSCEDSIEVLILGNSHSAYGVDPSEFSMYAYNLASVNQSLYFDKRLTLRYLDQMPKLKYVLISLDYHSLYFSSQGSRDVWSFYGHGIAYKDNEYLKERLSPFLFGYTPIVSATIIVRDLVRRIRYHGRNTIDFDVEEGVDVSVPVKKGFYPLQGTSDWKFSENAYKQRLGEFWWTEQIPGEYDEVMEDLEGFLGILQEKGIIPILYSCPIYAEYYKLYKQGILEKNSEAVNSIRDRFGIPFWNFMEDGRFVKEDFFNCDHLNADGAKKFSALLNDCLMEIDG